MKQELAVVIEIASKAGARDMAVRPKQTGRGGRFDSGGGQATRITAPSIEIIQRRQQVVARGRYPDGLVGSSRSGRFGLCQGRRRQASAAPARRPTAYQMV